MKRWAMPLALAVAVGLLLALNAGGLVRYLYPAAAIGIGAYLCLTDTARYTGYLLWLWTMTPFVRRVAEFQSGWQEPSPLLLTPYVVTAICFLRPMVHALVTPKPVGAWPPGRTMFVVTALGVACGMPLGLVTAPSSAMVDALNWMIPVGFGAYIASRHHELESIERTTVAALGGIVAVAGIYGVSQFVSPPAWDVDWMRNADMQSIGRPAPFEVRVFSTMHSPGVMAFFVLTALVAWLARPNLLGLAGAAVGAVALLLSQVRTGWMAFALAMILVLAGMQSRSRMRALLLGAVVVLAVSPLLPALGAGDLLASRAESLSDSPTFDRSGADRLEGHGRALEFVSRNPFGAGVGVAPAWIEEAIGMRDSTFVAGLVQLGVMGTLLYVFGMALLGTRLWSYYRQAGRPEAMGLACGGIGMLCTAGLAVPTAGPSGILVWLIAGLAAAEATAPVHSRAHVRIDEGTAQPGLLIGPPAWNSSQGASS